MIGKLHLWAEDNTPGLVAAVAFLLVAVVALAWQVPTRAQPPIIVIATATPGLPTPAAHVAAEDGPRLLRATIAYAAPGGAPLGALEPGRPYVPVARYGSAWLQLDAAGSGRVWVLASDAGLTVNAALADLAPPTVQVVERVVVVERPAPAAAPQPAPAQYQALRAPQAAPPPVDSPPTMHNEMADWPRP